MSSKPMTCLAAQRTQQAGTLSQVWAQELAVQRSVQAPVTCPPRRRSHSNPVEGQLRNGASSGTQQRH